MRIEYKTLKGTEPEIIHGVFIDAFSDYQVKLDMSFDKFSNLMKRRSVDFSVSLGAFHSEKLIGFILNGKRLIEKQLVAYDSGTGVSQKYQGLKLGKTLLQENLRMVKEYGFSRCILEVITTNEKAFNLYKSSGFRVSRTFNCYKSKANEIVKLKKSQGIEITKGKVQDTSIAEFKSFCDFECSWQNTTDSIYADPDRFTVVLAKEYNKVVGYGLMEIETGDIPQIAVKRENRKNHIGTAILESLAHETKPNNLRLLNVPENNIELNAFLGRHKFNNFIQQYELEMEF